MYRRALVRGERRAGIPRKLSHDNTLLLHRHLLRRIYKIR